MIEGKFRGIMKALIPVEMIEAMESRARYGASERKMKK
jgi:hypothetical protein